MSNLIIDIGNSRIKAAIFDNDKIVHFTTFDSLDIVEIKHLLTHYPQINHAIVSSVRKDSSQLLSDLSNHLEFVLELDLETLLPIDNLYETPQTLGKDRIAAAVGASYLYSGRNVLVIDAGTAITYDFVNEYNQYEGGYISPGLTMRFKALNHFTEKLPLVEALPPGYIPGNNTLNSIAGGVQYGLLGELEYVIGLYSGYNDDLIVIITGGDRNYFEKLLKNHKFVALEITLIGLNRILNFNIEINKQE